MEPKKGKENELGTESVGKLLFRLSMPAIAAQVINVMYNMVDRMYIGHIPVSYTHLEAAKEIKPEARTGIITTSGLFYTGLMPTNNRLFSEAGVLAMEIEASVLFVIASVRGIKSGCIVAADGP